MTVVKKHRTPTLRYLAAQSQQPRRGTLQRPSIDPLLNPQPVLRIGNHNIHGLVVRLSQQEIVRRVIGSTDKSVQQRHLQRLKSPQLHRVCEIGHPVESWINVHARHNAWKKIDRLREILQPLFVWGLDLHQDFHQRLDVITQNVLKILRCADTAIGRSPTESLVHNALSREAEEVQHCQHGTRTVPILQQNTDFITIETNAPDLERILRLRRILTNRAGRGTQRYRHSIPGRPGSSAVQPP
mmetsp:Transcript_41868/g.100601  ORF Transcript_41868/g.100601 Transcript_41868/m.100601 type:complete len:242 (+) Transcript_41868:238-963(+)